jgi:plastocyanin
LRALAVALVALALPASASATTFDVGASGTSFTPSDLTVAPGDTVRWTNNGGQHNVHFEDEQFRQPASPSLTWPDPVQRTFPAAGRFAYFCDMHRTSGMTGVITVKSPDATPKPTPPLITPPEVTSLKAGATKKGFIKVRLRPSEAATARITLARRSRGRYRKVKAIKRAVGTKTVTVTFRGRRGKALKAGRYRVTVKLTDSSGNSGRTRFKKIRLS